MDSIKFSNGNEINTIPCDKSKNFRSKRSEYLIGFDISKDGNYTYAQGIDDKGNKWYGEVIDIDKEDGGLIVKMADSNIIEVWM